MMIRHPQVALRWHGRCYGQTDVGLSHEGLRRSRELSRAIMRRRDAHEIAAVVHSGLRRAAFLAELIAEAAGFEPHVDRRWGERDFGTWETRTWNSIWRETGDAMDRMLTDPAGFRPGAGETTAELLERTLAAWRALPSRRCVVVVTHAGPIACIRSWLEGAAWADLARFRIEEAGVIELPLGVTSA